MKIPNIITAYQQQKESGIHFHTELKKSIKLSDMYNATILLKREDQQAIRIFKIRGVYNKFLSLTQEEKDIGVVTASDGNHAQAVAFFCNFFKVQGTIFLPEVCFPWKIDLCQKYGKQFVKVIPAGLNFHEAHMKAQELAQEKGFIYIHPFDDSKIIEGHATMAIEILEDTPGEIDYLFVPVGGGGLASGVATYFKSMSPDTKVIGVQPQGATSMLQAIKHDKPQVVDDKISRFCDGSAVPFVGEKTYELCKKYLDDIVVVPEGKISTSILDLYNQGIAVEPAGALTVAVLDQYAQEIKGKRVCCIVSGGTVDLSRFDEFKEMSLLYEGLKYFFLIQMPLKPGILKNFVTFCLGQDDEISHVQFHKKNNREVGPCLVAIEVSKKENVNRIMENMRKMNLKFQIINEEKDLYDLLI